MKKVFLTLLFIITTIFSIAATVSAAVIENTADIQYSDINGNVKNQSSNKQSTSVTIQQNKSVSVQVNEKPYVKFNALETWYFTGFVTNTGKDNDSYMISTENIPNGTTVKFYQDKNGNKLIDPEDPVINMTPQLSSGQKMAFIISVTDNLGTLNGLDINYISNLKAVSTNDNLIEGNDVFVSKPIILSSTPTPTPTSTPGPGDNTIKPNISVRKTVFPNRRVQVGDTLSYSIEVINNGQEDAMEAKLFDQLPPQITMLTGSNPSASDGGKISYSTDKSNWQENFDQNTRYIRVEWPVLQVGLSYNFYFQAKVNENVEEESIENVAWVDFYDYPDDKDNTTIVKETTRAISNNVVSNVKNDYTVEGTVYDKKTGLPKGDVKVILLKDGKEVGSDVTGKTGKFKIDAPGKGEYEIIYVDNKSGETISSRSTKVEKIGKNPSPIEISGTVMDSQSNKPIPNAKLEILDKDAKVILTLISDENGEYKIIQDAEGNLIKSGTYIIRVTQADNHVSYMKVQVTVNEGDMIVNLNLLVDPFGTVYDAIGGKSIPINASSVRLLNDCNNLDSLVKLEDLIGGEKQENPQITEENGFYQYFLTEDQLTYKRYCMAVSAEGYKPRKFFLRTMPSTELKGKYMVEVTDEDGKTTLIKNVETVPYDVPLMPIRILDITKKANKTTVDIGGVVTYTVEVTNKLKFTLKNGKMQDYLPFGFKYVEGTLRVDGQPVTDFKAVNELEVNLGDLKSEKKFVIMYQTLVGVRTDGDGATNHAYASGAIPDTAFNTNALPTNIEIPLIENNRVIVGPAEATVYVRKGVFRNNGTVIGRVYIDNNNNGIYDNGDQGVSGASLYTSNGLRIVSDNKGKYSVPDVPSGNFLIHLDKSTLKDDLYIAKDAIQLVDSLNQQIKNISVSEVPVNNQDKTSIVTDGNEFSFSGINGRKILLETVDSKIYELKEGMKFSVKDLMLKEKLNKLTVKDVTDESQGKWTINLYYLPAQEMPVKESWIGEDDILRRLFIPASGLAKANFRLVKLDKLTVNLPEEAVIPSLAALFVYPSQIAVKEIPYISYPDIKGHWAQKIVEYESGLEIIHGYPDGQFKPARDISRAEATKLTLVASKSYDIQAGANIGYLLKNKSQVTVKALTKDNKLVKSFYQNENQEPGFHILFWNGRNMDEKLLEPGEYNIEVSIVDQEGNSNNLVTSLKLVEAVPNYHPTGKADFKDIRENHWAHPFIREATEEKIVSGYPDNTFRPDNTIPRYEMAVVGVNVLGLDISKATDNLNFADADEIPEWARPYVSMAYQYKLLPEFPGNRFYPNRAISRAEVAAFVKELISNQKLEKKLKGVVSPLLKKVTIDGQEIDLNENKSFEIPVNKQRMNDIKTEVPGFETIEKLEDKNYIFQENERY